jgi:hypothetical protein
VLVLACWLVHAHVACRGPSDVLSGWAPRCAPCRCCCCCLRAGPGWLLAAGWSGLLTSDDLANG